ncbi:MAG: GAF domain-containing protein [Desulfobulbaceae bacterium]|nr:GAF domain-containing protein [Desulfobulbaceae bacterium]HIJ89816.1 GAF domain-containing protein [Deltaproteobacteria bacterium]
MLTELFADLSEPWPEACFLLAEDGKIVAANPAGAAMFGLSPHDATGRQLGEFVRESAETIADYLAACAGNRQQVPGTLSRLEPDGQILQYSCFGYRSQGNTPESPLIFLRCFQTKTVNTQFTALNQQIEQQLATHQQLMTSHTMLKTVLDSLEALVYVADMETYEVLFANKYCRDLLGDITGSICWQTIQTGQTGPCPFCTNPYLLTADGKPDEVYTWNFQNTVTGRWFHIHDRAIPWIDGRLVRLEIATDITALKEAEEKTRRDEEQTKALLNLAHRSWTSKDAMADYALAEAVRLTNSAVGYLHFINEDQQTIELLSWSPGVQAECSAAKSTHYPVEKAGIWADCIRLRQPVIINDYQNTPQRKGYPEGHFPLLRHLGVPVFDGERIVAIIGVGNKEQPYDQADANQLSLYMNNVWAILKQRLAEIKVRSIKDQWEKTFDAIDDIVTIHDHEMRIVQANRAAGALFQVTPADLIGRYCYEVFRGATEPCDGCPAVLARSDFNFHRATICHENLGKTFAASSFPLIDARGFTGFVHIAKDITGQIQMEQMERRLRQSQKMEAIGTLAGGIAHDFNNILAPIIGYTELALTKISPGDPLAGNLQQVTKAALRAKDLIQQILAFSRQSPHEKKPLQPHLVVKEALKLLRASLPSTIEIREEISPDCGAILADPTQLHQIIMNLCTNAYQAMRETGGVLGVSLSKVTIGVEDNKVTSSELSPGEYVLLGVSDTGCGMDRATLARIFEPYFTTKGKGEGTGLGLSVVHGIVNSHHGQVTVYSEPGQGTNFHVYLPRVSESPILPIGSVCRETIPTGTERLLVVDDEVMITDMLQAILENLGYHVTVCGSSLKALALVEHDPTAFDLMITDMTMPGLTGFELARKALAISPDLPVILCTGFSELINKEQAQAMGIRAYLMKPVSVRELANTVRKGLDEK